MVVAISDRSSLCCLGYCPSNVSFTPEYVLRSQLIGQKVFTYSTNTIVVDFFKS